MLLLEGKIIFTSERKKWQLIVRRLEGNFRVTGNQILVIQGFDFVIICYAALVFVHLPVCVLYVNEINN